MLKRFKVGTGALLGLAALALGGSAIAGASSSPTHAQKVSVVSTAAEPKATGPDTDTIQSGDQTTPDSAKASNASESTTSESSSPSDGPGGHADSAGIVDNQSGDQSTPDAAKASESSTSESSSPSDGPGGHADAAGTVDNQQQGQN